MKKFRGIITLLAISMFVSCDSISYTESISPISDTELPSTANVGETITFTVYHAVFNGCGRLLQTLPFRRSGGLEHFVVESNLSFLN